MPTRPPTIGQTSQPRPRYDPRASAASRGYGHRWAAYARAYLSAHPMCAACATAGRTTLAQLVDHIRPVTQGQADPLFWPATNHQPLCRRHHARKTAEDMRQGLTRRL